MIILGKSHILEYWNLAIRLTHELCYKLSVILYGVYSKMNSVVEYHV